MIFAFFGVICIQQDKVNTADSEFIFLIILLISQNLWLGWSGRRRWSCLIWSLLEDSQDDFDSEYIGFDGSLDDQHGIYAFIYVRNVRCHACDTRTHGHTDSGKVVQYSV